MTVKLTKLSWLEELYALSQAAAAVTVLEDALKIMLTHIADGFSAGSGTLALTHPSDPRLEIVAGTDLPKEAIGRQIEFGQGVLGRVAQQGDPMLINGTLEASQTSRPQGPNVRKAPSSSMCWPLKLKGRTIGVLAVNRFAPQPDFDDKDLQRGSIMVNMLALVIENLRMHREQQQRIAHLSMMNEEMARMNRQLAETQAQLLQREKMASIGQLAAGVAHEINNPLGFVSSNLRSLTGYVHELIRKVSVDPEQVAADEDLQYLMDDVPVLIDETRNGLERVRKIVQDLRDFSRVDSVEEWEFADINASIQSTINVGLADHRGRIEVVTQFADLPPVQCLSSQINQVLLSVITNAAQAIKDTGTITLKTAMDATQEKVWIEISDTGSGIPPEVIGRIFEPFFTTKPVGTGTGLGLSLAYSIMKKHHGGIEAQSQMGLGSVFKIWLPTKHLHNDHL